MRVRIVKGFWWRDGNRNMKPGDVGEVPDADAQLWLRHGMAMQDKTVDVPENKAEPVFVTKATPPRRKRKAKK